MRRAASTGAAFLFTFPVSHFIVRYRNRLEGGALPLDAETKRLLAPYFPSDDLERARTFVSDPLPISDPPFAAQARRLGFDFPSVALVGGITFEYVIAAPAPMPVNLLFHELVHVVQFRLLGVRRFIQLYIRGFLMTGSYDRIPLERCAVELERRFLTEAAPFDVESEVRYHLAMRDYI